MATEPHSHQIRRLIGNARRSIGWLVAHPSIPVFGAASLLILVALVLLLIEPVRSDFVPNLAPELIGIAASAVITVLIVERALAASEKRRWEPSVQATFHRLLAQCDRAVSHLGMYFRSRPGEMTVLSPRAWVQLLSEAIRSAEIAADLHSFAHDWVFSEVSTRNQQIQTMTSQWQVIVSRHPDLFPCIQAIDDAIANWSFTRHFFESGVPQTNRELELDGQAVRPVAEAFLALRAELLNALPEDFEGE